MMTIEMALHRLPQDVRFEVYQLLLRLSERGVFTALEEELDKSFCLSGIDSSKTPEQAKELLVRYQEGMRIIGSLKGVVDNVEKEQRNA